MTIDSEVRLAYIKGKYVITEYVDGLDLKEYKIKGLNKAVNVIKKYQKRKKKIVTELPMDKLTIFIKNYQKKQRYVNKPKNKQYKDFKYIGSRCHK